MEKVRSTLASYEVSSRLICGGVAGSLAKTIVAPAERVKMSFQITNRPFTLTRAWYKFCEMVRYDGVRSLWRGHSTMLVRVAPYAGSQFAVHDYMENTFLNMLDRPTKLPAQYKFAAGAVAGTVATLLTYPLDVLRVRIAFYPNATWRSTLAGGGLWHGLAPTMAGIIPYSGTVWCVKHELHHMYPDYNDGLRPGFYAAIFLNGLAGLAGQFITYPLDVLRRRQQFYGRLPDKDGRTRVKNMPPLRSTFMKIMREEGTRGVFKGFTMNIFKGPITVSVSMTTYDVLMKWIHEKEGSDRR